MPAVPPAGPAGIGGVRAYGVVSSGSLVAARSMGFADVTRPEAGTYCLTLADASIDPTTIAPVVGVEWDSSSGFSLNAYASVGASDCPEGTDVGVKTYQWTSTTESEESNQVAFTIVVP